MSVSLPLGTIGTHFETQVLAQSGTPPYHFSLTGSNPPFLQITDDGVLSGTPVTSGTYAINIAVTDSAGPPNTATAAYTFTVLSNETPPLQINTTSLPNATYGADYNAAISIQGGTPPYGVGGSGMPANLQVNPSTGAVFAYNLIADPGTYSFTYTVTDHSSPMKQAQTTFSLTVVPGLLYTGNDFPGGTVGQPYSAQTHISGGTAPYSVTTVSGSLPPGLSLSSNGTLSGTPARVGSYSFGVKVTDANGLSGTATSFVTIAGVPLTVSATLPTVGHVGEPITPITLTTTGGIAPYTYVYSGGLNFDVATHTVTGTPTDIGDVGINVLVTDSVGSSGNFTSFLPVIGIFPDSLPPGAVGQAFSAGFTPRPAEFLARNPAFSMTGVPPGLHAGADGGLSGTPTTAGTYTVTVTANGGGPWVATKSYSLVVIPATQVPLTILPGAAPTATKDVAYSFAISAYDGTPPYTVTMDRGTLPPGVTLNSSGLVSGTPTAGGSYPFDVTLRDSAGRSGTKGFQINVGVPTATLVASAPSTGLLGQPYSASFSVVNGTGTYTFAVDGGIPGLSMNPTTGVYSGTPTMAGVFSIFVTATAGTSVVYSNITVRIQGASGDTLSLTSSIPSATVGLPYQASVYLANPTGSIAPPATWTISGTLPPGITTDQSLGDRIMFGGNPTTAGNYTFHLVGKDQQNRTGSNDYSINVVAQPIVINPTTLPNATINVPYSATFTASGGTPPYTYTATHMSSGSLSVAGWISSDGVMQFTPNSVGRGDFLLRATDSNGLSGTQSYSLIVGAASSITLSSLPNGALNTSYSASVTATGGTAPYTFVVSSGSLPAGLALATSGAITGSPTRAGSFVFTITATDHNGVVAAKDYQMTVQGASLTFSPASLPDATQGHPYSVQITVTGGTAPYSFSMTGSGVWDAGLSLQSNGLISGSPQASNTNLSLNVQVTDANGSSAIHTYTIRVGSSSTTHLGITPPLLPAATVGQPYSATIIANGGAPPYTFTVGASTPLPAGLSMSSAGALSGTPTTPGTGSFNVNVQDANGATGSGSVQLTVNSLALTLGPSELPPVKFNQAYSVAITAAGATGAYTVELIYGALPPGLSLQSNSIVGTPTVNNTLDYSFTLQAKDQQQSMGTRTYTLHVDSTGSVVISISPATLLNPIVGVPYSAHLTASGGQAPYRFYGDMPAGLTLSEQGAISGSAIGKGLQNFTATAVDANGVLGTRSYTFTVVEPNPNPPVIKPMTLPPTQQNISVEEVLQVDSGSRPFVWMLTKGSLPPGVTLSTDGVLRGTPVAAGQFSFTITITDNNNGTDSIDLTWQITADASANTLFFDAQKLDFNGLVGGTTSAAQCLTAFATRTTVSVQVAVDAAWATANANTLKTPSSVCLSANIGDLAPGTHSGLIRFTSAQTQPSTYTIPISLTVQEIVPANITAAPNLLRISTVRNGPDTSGFLTVTNSGGAASTFTVQKDSSAWLSIAQPSGSIPAGGSITVPITANVSGLPAGVYTATVAVNSPGKSDAIGVELSISEAPGLIALSKNSLEFVTWTGGATASASIGLVNQGTIDVNPVVAVSTNDSTSWLTADMAGTSLPPGAAIPVHVVVDPHNLQPGRYTGNLTVNSTNASNGPQTAVVGITVLPAGALLPDDATVYGLALTPRTPEGSIFLNVTPGGALTYNAVASGADSSWLTVTPSQGIIPMSGALNLTVDASTAGVFPGLHSASISIGLSDGTVRTVPVDLFVPAPVTPPPARTAIQSCGGATNFVAHLLAPIPAFVGRIDRALPIKVQAENCDASPASGLSITIHAGGDDFTLLPESPGVWSGSWTPSTNGDVVLTATISRPDNILSTVSLAARGSVSASTDTHAIVRAVVSAASPILDRPVVSGSWITIYGSNLASATDTVQNFPLPTVFEGVRISIGDQAVPLYFVSPGQINAVAPSALNPGVSYQLVLSRDGVAGVPVSVTIADSNPAIFTVNQQGTGQAAAVLAGTRDVASATNPISRGSAMEIYATGLGVVSNPPNDGIAASLDVLAPTLQSVSATVGGRTARVLFAGLTPGSVGLYQVNLIIPDDAPIGEAIPVVITQAGKDSNIGTIAIK